MKIEDFNLYRREVVNVLTGETGAVIDIVDDNVCVARSWGNAIVKTWMNRASLRTLNKIHRNQHAGIK